jgi:hypothetical protein
MRWLFVVLLCSGVAYAQPAPQKPAPEKPAPTAAQKKEAAAHRARAKAFSAKHQNDKAIVELEASVAIVASPDALYELAKLYDQVPDEDKAFTAYQRIVEGKHLAEAESRMTAIIAGRAQRKADADAKAVADAKAKAEEEERVRRVNLELARRKADEDRRHAEEDDRKRRHAEADARETALRTSIEVRDRERILGARRGEWEVDREKRRQRRERAKHFLTIGVACSAMAGLAAGVALLEHSRIDNPGMTTEQIATANSITRIATYTAVGFAVPGALGIVIGVPLFVIARDRGEMRVTAVSSDSMHGIALSGVLP